MADPRQCFMGNIPCFMDEESVKDHIGDLGFVVPLKVVVRAGRGEHVEEQYGIATFQTISDCERLKLDGSRWPNGQYCLIK